jgi:predicted nucleotidyltransferase component of viral defense system
MLQTRTVYPDTLGLLKELMKQPLLSNHFLVGGTSLALQMGHRFSVDLDLFTHTDFEADVLLAMLESHYKVQLITKSNTIFISVVEGVKVDSVRFRYPFAFPLIETDGIRLADIRDVAPMKLDAVMKRGNKKDFFDMYYLFELFTPDEIMGWYKTMFKHETTFHVIRSLVYFEDAEQTENPVLFDKSVTWAKVKNRLVEIVQKNF